MRQRDRDQMDRMDRSLRTLTVRLDGLEQRIPAPPNPVEKCLTAAEDALRRGSVDEATAWRELAQFRAQIGQGPWRGF